MILQYSILTMQCPRLVYDQVAMTTQRYTNMTKYPLVCYIP